MHKTNQLATSFLSIITIVTLTFLFLLLLSRSYLLGVGWVGGISQNFRFQGWTQSNLRPGKNEESKRYKIYKKKKKGGSIEHQGEN